MKSTTKRHQTIAERAAFGKQARAEVPRSSHAAWQPAADRPNPVDLLEEQAKSRVPELIPIRYGRMSSSAFAFYRGGAALMANDLAAEPRSGLTVQLCGDAHLSNFGAFAAPDRRLVFSINDFDETLPGPFEWDVKRLVASFEVAARDRGFDDKTRKLITTTCGRVYRTSMAEFAQMGWLDLWYSRLDADDIANRFASDTTRKQRERLDKTLEKSRSKNRLRAMEKLTHVVDGKVRFLSTPPLLVPIDELFAETEAERLDAAIHGVIRDYRKTLPHDRKALLERYRYVHAARKVVGVGSVGTRAFVMLLEGRDDQDPLILQLKEAQRSVLEPYLGTSSALNHGQRVVMGQQMTQAASDIMLGWHRTEGLDGVKRDFYVRQLWDGKGSAEVETMPPDGMRRYAELCSWTLARAHARSGDPVAIASYLGNSDTFDRSMAAFATSYAGQNEADHARLVEAIASGRVEAADEVV